MSTKPTNSPHAPKPTGPGLAKRVYKVEDKDGKLFGSDLTWDEAWKRKEEVAGQRKSTTPRIKLMDAPLAANGHAAPVLPGWSEAQRLASLVKASTSIPHPPAVVAFDELVDRANASGPGALTAAAIADLNRSAEADADAMMDGVEVGGDALLRELAAGGDDDIDGLIDEANAAGVLEH